LERGDKVANCRFCEIYKSHKNIVLETDHFYMWFDEFPLTPGHAEMVAKRHVASLLELKRTEWVDLQNAIQEGIDRIEKTNLRTLYKNLAKKPRNKKSKRFYELMLKHIGLGEKPDGYNFGVNEGEAAGRTVEHLHMHIIPRYFGDVRDPTGGVRNIFAHNIANYKK